MSVTLIFLRRSICSSGSISPDGHACRAHPGRLQVREAEQRAKGAGEQTAVRLKQCVLRSLPVNGVNNKRRLVDLPMVLSDTAHAAWIWGHRLQHMERPLIFQRRAKPVIHSCPFSRVAPIFRLHNGCSSLMQELLLMNNVCLWETNPQSINQPLPACDFIIEDYN